MKRSVCVSWKLWLRNSKCGCGVCRRKYDCIGEEGCERKKQTMRSEQKYKKHNNTYQDDTGNIIEIIAILRIHIRRNMDRRRSTLLSQNSNNVFFVTCRVLIS